MKIFHELFFVSTLMAYYHYADLGICPKSRDGNGVGQGRRMGSLFSPCMVLSCPVFALPCMTGKIFLLHPYSLGPCEAPSYPIKLYFLLIYPTSITNFFN